VEFSIPSRFQPEVESVEEWETKWKEFVRLARKYGWPEYYLQAYLQDHRVSYQERIESLDKQRHMWEDLQHRADWNDWVKHYAEIVFKNKRKATSEPRE